MLVRLLLPTLAIVAGCATTITPPRGVADPAVVYLIDYGRHSSIMLRTNGEVKEYCFGDFNWFAINRNTRGDALRALFNSAGSTLGRREVELPDDTEKIQSMVNAEAVYRLKVPRAKAEALMGHLDTIFDGRRESLTHNPRSDVWFVRTADRYSAWHNCNHVTNRWLQRLGVKTRGTKMFSRFKVKR